jgi:hypothetical protein
MNDEEFEDFIENKYKPAFQEGFVAGRLGLPVSDLVMDTKWGPIEGTRAGNQTIRWDFPDHQWAEVRYLADGGMELYKNDRLVSRSGPVEIEQDEPDDNDEARDP